VLDLGNGVSFAIFMLTGRPDGTSAQVQMRYAGVGIWEQGSLVRATNYTDVDDARAAAERLAESGG